jgi:hypothetical protein
MQATKKLPSSKCKHQDGQKGCAGLCLETARDFDLNVSTNTRLFSNEVGSFCQCHKKVWEIKEVDEMICHFTSTQKIMI